MSLTSVDFRVGFRPAGKDTREKVRAQSKALGQVADMIGVEMPRDVEAWRRRYSKEYVFVDFGTTNTTDIDYLRLLASIAFALHHVFNYGLDDEIGFGLMRAVGQLGDALVKCGSRQCSSCTTRFAAEQPSTPGCLDEALVAATFYLGFGLPALVESGGSSSKGFAARLEIGTGLHFRCRPYGLGIGQVLLRGISYYPPTAVLAFLRYLSNLWWEVPERLSSLSLATRLCRDLSDLMDIRTRTRTAKVICDAALTIGESSYEETREQLSIELAEMKALLSLHTE